MKSPLTPSELEIMTETARSAASSAYAPYSNFHVGAAILFENGEIVGGANVENACYGLGNCAERSAIFAGATKGFRKIRAVVVYTPTQTPTFPCGACRQVINEFGADAEIISLCDSKTVVRTTLAQLLPDSFGPKDLGK